MTCYKNCGSGTVLPSQDDVQQICSSALQDLLETFIIVDALDECNEISQVTLWLKKLVTAGGGKLHVLITSRDRPDITNQFSRVPQQQIIHLDDFTDPDIKLYIDLKMQEFEKLVLWNQETQTKIREHLLAGAGGM